MTYITGRTGQQRAADQQLGVDGGGQQRAADPQLGAGGGGQQHAAYQQHGGGGGGSHHATDPNNPWGSLVAGQPVYSGPPPEGGGGSRVVPCTPHNSSPAEFAESERLRKERIANRRSNEQFHDC